MQLKAYKKKLHYSYTLGLYPTIELLQFRPDAVIQVIVSTQVRESSGISKVLELCHANRIEVETNDKLIDKLSPKENSYVIGVFHKHDTSLDHNQNHVTLVNPNNMGNLGTIMRTVIGFGLNNLAIITPAVDIFDPKVVRASMGAIFKLNFQHFDSFESYMDLYHQHNIYTFMLDGALSLKDLQSNSVSNPFTLVFGNESNGLDDEFQKYGTSIVIPHTNTIDSLNLTIAVGIASYEFTK